MRKRFAEGGARAACCVAIPSAEEADGEIDHIELEMLLNLLVGVLHVGRRRLGFESRGQQVGHARQRGDALWSVHGGADGCTCAAWRLQACNVAAAGCVHYP